MLNDLYYTFFKSKLKNPISLIFFVTNRCNARCLHCFNWKLQDKGEDLTIEQINDFSKQIGKIRDVSLSGGEPFLRKDIDKICSIFIENNEVSKLTIPTNGLLPDIIFDKLNKILRLDSKTSITLGISLDNVGEEHDKVRGVKGNYIKVLKTYNKIVSLKKYKNFSIKILTTISNQNIKDIPSLINKVKEDFPDIDFHGFEIVRGSPRDKKIRVPSIRDLNDIKGYIFNAWDYYSFYRSSKIKSYLAVKTKRYIFNTYIDIINKKEQLIPCYAPRLTCVINANGNIYFCELLKSIGNIKGRSFGDIWNSKEAEDMRLMVKQKKCYCYHSCFQQKNIFMNYKLYPKLFFNLFR